MLHDKSGLCASILLWSVCELEFGLENKSNLLEYTILSRNYPSVLRDFAVLHKSYPKSDVFV